MLSFKVGHCDLASNDNNIYFYENRRLPYLDIQLFNQTKNRRLPYSDIQFFDESNFFCYSTEELYFIKSIY